jgi:hypothetical protein
VTAFQHQSGETGASTTHRQEAGRLASSVHDAVHSRSSDELPVADGILLAMLHAMIYIGDEIHELVNLAKAGDH